MLKNYFIINWRRIWRNPFFTFLNLIGLSLGIASCLTLFLFVNYEWQFDRFHQNHKNIVRLTSAQRFEGMNEQFSPLTMYKVGEDLKERYPEVEEFIRLWNLDFPTLQRNNNRIVFDKFYYSDASFFNIFSFKLLSGNPQIALSKPNTVVITENTAEKLFGSTNPIGKTLEYVVNEKEIQKFTVTGVVENPPAQSHLQFDGLFSFQSIKVQAWMKDVGSNWLYTYLLLNPTADIAKLEADFPNYLKTYDEQAPEIYTLFLQPLVEIHLGSSHYIYDSENYQKFNKTYTYIFLALAIFTLLMAIFNYINLSTAKSTQRGKEIGLRKVIGAKREQLISQVLSESVIFSIIASLFAILLLELSLPFINDISQRDLSLWKMPLYFWLTFPLFLVLVGVMAGLYPALIISGFSPKQAFSQNFHLPNQKFSLRNILVVSQFSIAIALIVATFLVIQQLNFLYQKDLGYNQEEIILLKTHSNIQADYYTFKEELLKNPYIKEVAGSSTRLGKALMKLSFYYKTDKAEKEISASLLRVDYDYLKTYEIEISEGRTFSKEFADGEKKMAFLINETLAEKLGYENPIGKHFSYYANDSIGGEIIGVFKDFHHNNLHNEIESMAIALRKNPTFGEISIKIEGKNEKEAINHLTKTWEEFFPNDVLAYTFLKDYQKGLYQTEKQISQIIGIFTFLAVLIASLGLFGLASFTLQRRTKEIGIRKILGASFFTLLNLLMIDFLKWVFIAMLIAFPLVYWLINQWLNSFPYHIDIGASSFIISGLIALSIASITIFYHVFKTANASPVEVIRYE